MSERIKNALIELFDRANFQSTANENDAYTLNFGQADCSCSIQKLEIDEGFDCPYLCNLYAYRTGKTRQNRALAANVERILLASGCTKTWSFEPFHPYRLYTSPYSSIDDLLNELRKLSFEIYPRIEAAPGDAQFCPDYVVAVQRDNARVNLFVGDCLKTHGVGFTQYVGFSHRSMIGKFPRSSLVFDLDKIFTNLGLTEIQ